MYFHARSAIVDGFQCFYSCLREEHEIGVWTNCMKEKEDRDRSEITLQKISVGLTRTTGHNNWIL